MVEFSQKYEKEWSYSQQCYVGFVSEFGGSTDSSCTVHSSSKHKSSMSDESQYIIENIPRLLSNRGFKTCIVSLSKCFEEIAPEMPSSKLECMDRLGTGMVVEL